MTVISTKTIDIKIDKECTTYPLGHIPDVRLHWEGNAAAFAGRAVHKYQVADFEDGYADAMDGTYILLRNIDRHAGLSINLNKNWSDIEDRLAWGAAFLCKLGQPPITNGMANYINVPEEIIADKIMKSMMRADVTSRGYKIKLDSKNNDLGYGEGVIKKGIEFHRKKAAQSSKDAGKSSS